MTIIRESRTALHPFLSFGFRPFFLAAGTFAALAMLLWLPLFLGDIDLPIRIAPRDWHIHEMVYGYATAAIAGFLLTAIANWTGRPPIGGPLLLALVVAWIAGRIATATSGLIGLDLAVLGDFLFLPMLAVVATRELVAAGNRRNYKLLAVLALLIAGNAVFHAETMMEGGVADYGERFGLATVIGLIVLIAGRIVPSFTRNALVRQGPGRLPEPFGRIDIAVIALSVVALGLWVVVPHSAATAALAGIAGLLQAVRLLRWAGDRARNDALVLVLHIAYGFIPAGFLLLAGSALAPELAMAAAAAHAWGVGAIGLMTLAVMTRATLGHTGRPLSASRATVAVYALAIVAALARIAAAFPSSFDNALLYGAAAAWVAAFAGFAAIYGPMLLGPKLADSSGG